MSRDVNCMNQLQQQTRDFIDQNDLQAPPEYRLLDLFSEVGELAKDANTSSNYGSTPTDLTLNEDEIGDVLFALLALATDQNIDIDEAFQQALTKYETRVAETESPASGR